jgi:muramoyltetrapeptide carboxypeptidase
MDPRQGGMMLKPRALKKGSIVAVFAPASPVEQDALLQGVTYLNSMGFRTKISDLIFSRYHYFAGFHEERATELNRLFADPDVDAIFCARGGYGCVHLRPYLDSAIIRSNPKIFLGYSDVTVLLQYLESQTEMVCFHGRWLRVNSDRERLHLMKAIFRLCRPGSGTQNYGGGAGILTFGTAKGRLTGGCLSLASARHLLRDRYQ